MNMHPPVTYQHSQFTWSKNSGFAEASDLGCRTGIPGGEIYSHGAKCWGFTVVGKKREVEFIFTSYIRSREGDIEGWRFVSVGGLFTILIAND